MVRAYLDDWDALREEIAATAAPPASQTITLATATLFAPTLRRTAAEFAALTGCAVTVVPILNTRLGETITVSGLLMAGDAIDQLQAAGVADLVVLPRVMFDHPDTVSLDDLSPQDVANRLGRPVALADSLGDVWDALRGESRLLFRPGVAPGGSIDLRVLGDDAGQSAAHLS